MLRILFVLVSIFAFNAHAGHAGSHGALHDNRSSSIGTNLTGLAPFYAEQPFLNFWKMAVNWSTRTTTGSTCPCPTTGEEALLYSSFLDANGYPTTLTGGPAHTFTAVSASTLYSLPSPYYPGGANSWLLKWDGGDASGSTPWIFVGDQTLSSHSCTGGTCTDTLNVTPSGSGMTFILYTMPSPIVTNIRLVPVAQYNALTTAQKAAFDVGPVAGSTAGIFFNSDWLAIVKQFRGLRYMDWGATNTNAEVTWASRPTPSWVFWDDNIKFYQDAPLEVMIAASNTLHANAWLAMPCLADSNFQTQAATLTLGLLDPSLQVILESCNEAWNHNFSTAVLNGLQNDQSIFPSCTIGFSCLIDNFIWRTVQMAQLWGAVWTGDNDARLLPVMGGQLGNFAGINELELNQLATADGGASSLWTGKAGTHVKATSVAPYWTFAYQSPFQSIPASWTADADGGINKVYTQTMTGGLLPTANVTGNCGNGAGKTCGGTTNYTLTSGLSLPATPANGTCIAATMNSTSVTNPNLAVDGGTSFPVIGNDGVNGMTLTNNVQYAFCFTNATSAGAVTASWQLASVQSTCGASEYICIQTELADAVAFLSTFGNGSDGQPLRLVGYEGGQTLVDACNGHGPNQICGGNTGSSAIDSLMTNYQTSPEIAKSYTAFMSLFKSAGLIEWHNFTDPGPWTTGQAYWGWSNSTYGPTTPRQAALYDYIRRVPCWWANCAIQ